MDEIGRRDQAALAQAMPINSRTIGEYFALWSGPFHGRRPERACAAGTDTRSMEIIAV
jgi:hypothetical protein